MTVELLRVESNQTATVLQDSANWPSSSVSVIAMSAMAVLLAVFCACLLGPRLARMATACCLCDLPLPLPPSGHIPYRCGQSQADRGALDPCLMCDRGAAALTEQHRTLAQSAQRDSELGLPTTLPLPDGEEFPHSTNRVHIRTPEQEKEIYQACIRPPPNRTIGSRQLSPPMEASAAAAPTGMCAGRFIANCAKSRPLRLENRKRCDPPVIPPELTVIVPTQRVDNSVGSAPRPPERQAFRAVGERQPTAPVATSIGQPLAPPVTRSSRRLAGEVQPARAVPGRRVSGRLAARAAAAAAGLFSRQRWQ